MLPTGLHLPRRNPSWRSAWVLGWAGVALVAWGAGARAAPLFSSFLSIDADSPKAVAAGDLNNDGRPDLALAEASRHLVTVLLNMGGGGFTHADAVDTGIGLLGHG